MLHAPPISFSHIDHKYLVKSRSYKTRSPVLLFSPVTLYQVNVCFCYILFADTLRPSQKLQRRLPDFDAVSNFTTSKYHKTTFHQYYNP